MLRSHRWGVVLCVAAGLAATAPPSVRSQEAQVGVEVQARGPIHEAFASLTGDPTPTKGVGKQPPAPLDEVPPDERPDGDVVWISGYWAWDEDRDDFIWVSGLWRTVPPGKQWVAGYWREGESEWQWVPGFWTGTKEEDQQMSYLPELPETPNVAPPGKPPTEDSFYVPGIWVWKGQGYAWRSGYWARQVPGWVWVPDHYRWTPSGHVFVSGYWDLAVSKRGILYAPVYVSPAVRVSYVYTPSYAVRDTLIVDTLFVRPTTCHYYFGDYYEVRYRDRGYQSCVVYSQSRYDSIIVYERYERRRDPTWVNVQINLYNDRCAGRQPVPPRVINQNVVQQNVVQQNVVRQNVVHNHVTNVTNVNNTTVNNNTRNVSNDLSIVAPTKAVVENKKVSMVKVDDTTRTQAKQQAQAVQAVSQQRSTSEKSSGPPARGQVKTAALSVPKTQPVKQGMVAPKPPPAVKVASPTSPSQPNVNHLNNLPNKTAAPTKSGGTAEKAVTAQTNPPVTKPATPTSTPAPKALATQNSGATAKTVPPATTPVVKPLATGGTHTVTPKTNPQVKALVSQPTSPAPKTPAVTTSAPKTNPPAGQAVQPKLQGAATPQPRTVTQPIPQPKAPTQPIPQPKAPTQPPPQPKAVTQPKVQPIPQPKVVTQPKVQPQPKSPPQKQAPKDKDKKDKR